MYTTFKYTLQISNPNFNLFFQIEIILFYLSFLYLILSFLVQATKINETPGTCTKLERSFPMVIETYVDSMIPRRNALSSLKSIHTRHRRSSPERASYPKVSHRRCPVARGARKTFPGTLWKRSRPGAGDHEERPPSSPSRPLERS